MHRRVLPRVREAAVLVLSAILLIVAATTGAQPQRVAVIEIEAARGENAVIAWTEAATALDAVIASTEGAAAIASSETGRADAAVTAPTALEHLAEAVNTAADAALRALAKHVRRESDPAALRTTFRAYYSYRALHADRVRKPYLYYVDLGLDNRSARGYVFDMETLTVVDGPFMVAHGRGSSRERNGVPTRFSNQPGSNASSLGLYLAEETYGFSGRAGGRPYKSVGLRMRGESGGFNDAARRRGIVAHGAPYVTAREAGRSEGCPAMEQHRAQRLLPLLAEGGVVFIYSPHDRQWLREDPWFRAE